MLELQVICKNVVLAKLEAVLAGEADIKIVDRKHHLRVCLEKGAETKAIVEKCRTVGYAYLRAVAWECGGRYEKTGRAVCVAGLGGEPLLPISVRTRGETANSKHALFSSRKGFLVAEAIRGVEEITISVVSYRVGEMEMLESENLYSSSIEVSEKGEVDIDAALTEIDVKHDRLIPLLRGTLKKVCCQFCTHPHYRAVKE